MQQSYPVFDVSNWEIDRSEPMGTKEKDWRINPEDGRRWLLKLARLRDREAVLYAGEDWAEKLAAEIAEQLGIPHARVELAILNGRPGIVCLDFVDDPSWLQLVHGNELMYRKFLEAYPKTQKRHVFLHTVANVMRVLSEEFIHPPDSVSLPDTVRTATDVFVGYLLLDALIGNTDRHHENWAILEDRSQEALYAKLSPTFDHASSLGRELTDDSRAKGLGGEKPSVAPDGYASRAKSAFFEHENDAAPASPSRVFQVAAALRPQAATAWLQRLADCPKDTFRRLVDAVPAGRMSSVARDFTVRLLEYNRQSLLSGAK